MFFYLTLLIFASFSNFSQFWLPTVQEVLQADWQVLLHSPQPVFFLALGVATNLILFIIVSFNFPYIRFLSRATQKP